jgi:phytoene dehydrogenase-like protein
VRQGALVQGQTFADRPHPDCSTTRTPVEGLYLGGGGVHPGVPGSLAGGYNAATAVCSDLGLERWWPEPPMLQHAREAGLLPEPVATS